MPTNTICFINQKGGCGKSSSCFHLAGHFASLGLRVLAIDADPQGSLSQGFFGSEAIEIDCCFDEGELTASQVLEQQLIENCLREDLQPIEEARAFASLIELNAWTGKEVAEALRIHPSRVSRALALLKLPDEIQDQVNVGKISARSGYEISKLSNAAAQAKLAEKASAGELSHTQTSNAVRQRQGRAKLAARSTKQTFLSESGWKVIVTAPKKGTYFEIEQALSFALDEVRLRINSGCQLF